MLVHAFVRSLPRSSATTTLRPSLGWWRSRRPGLLLRGVGSTTRTTDHDDFSPEEEEQQQQRETRPTRTRPRVRLRNATLTDLPLLTAWDQKPHVIACCNDESNNKNMTTPVDDDDNVDDDDWNWSYELPRTDLSWRYQLIAEALFDTEDDLLLPSDDAGDGARSIKPIGCVQIIDPQLEETHYWGKDCESNQRAIDIWIGEEEFLGRGYGTAMMELVLSDYCFGVTDDNDDDDAVTAVLIDPLASNVAAHRFYQRLGFRPVGIRYFGGGENEKGIGDRCLVHRLERTDWLFRRRAQKIDSSR
jgi:aminoglycoside 6'-N-acetyltransferase